VPCRWLPGNMTDCTRVSRGSPVDRGRRSARRGFGQQMRRQMRVRVTSRPISRPGNAPPRNGRIQKTSGLLIRSRAVAAPVPLTAATTGRPGPPHARAWARLDRSRPRIIRTRRRRDNSTRFNLVVTTVTVP